MMVYLVWTAAGREETNMTGGEEEEPETPDDKKDQKHYTTFQR